MKYLVWLRRGLLLAVLSYLCFSMLLMGYICVGTALDPALRTYRDYQFLRTVYLTAGPLLLLGGGAVFFFSVRWLARLIKATGEVSAPESSGQGGGSAS